MPLGHVYALTAGVIWGFTPIFTKKAMAGASVRLVLVFGSTSGSLLLFLLAVLRGESVWIPEPPSTILAFIYIGITGSLIGRSLYIKGIEKVGGARATSVVNASPLITSFLAVAFLGEQFTPVIGVGILLIVLGIYLISSQRSQAGSLHFRRIDLLWPISSACIYSINPVIKRFGMTLSQSPLIGALYSHSTSAVIFLISFLIRPDWQEVRRLSLRHLTYLILSGCSMSLGAYFTFLAVSNQPAIVVSAIWRVSPLISLGLSFFLLREVERVTLHDVFGTLAIVGGVFVLIRLTQ